MTEVVDVTDAARSAASAGNRTRAAGLTPGTMRALEEAGLEVSDVVRVVRAALDEDFRYGADVTSAATVAGRTVTADVVRRARVALRYRAGTCAPTLRWLAPLSSWRGSLPFP